MVFRSPIWYPRAPSGLRKRIPVLWSPQMVTGSPPLVLRSTNQSERAPTGLKDPIRSERAPNWHRETFTGHGEPYLVSESSIRSQGVPTGHNDPPTGFKEPQLVTETPIISQGAPIWSRGAPNWAQGAKSGLKKPNLVSESPFWSLGAPTNCYAHDPELATDGPAHCTPSVLMRKCVVQ